MIWKAASLLTLFILSSCVYRMPDEDDLYTVPTTNNPMVTREKSSGMMPGASY